MSKRIHTIDIRINADDQEGVIDAMRAATKMMCEHGMERAIGGGHHSYSYRVRHTTCPEKTPEEFFEALEEGKKKKKYEELKKLGITVL